MQAAEASVQKILEGSKQFLIPHFQRPYSWRDAQWSTLWRDLLDLVEDTDAKPHFLGPIVSAPARSVPEGVEKRLLIDGQQRLTTLLILLALIRDRARETNNTRLADRIQDLITNRHDDGLDHYKVLPTQGEDSADSDRDVFVRLVNQADRQPSENRVLEAYEYFAARLRRQDAPDLDALHRTITAKLTLVSIILDEKDNPYRIFESLNGKGRPLSQADLIRNYFFMRLHEREHERAYLDLWRPMQRRLGEEALTDFVRHYLTRDGTLVRETDVYAALKNRVDGAGGSPLEHLRELSRYSEYYEVLLHPEKAPSPALRERFARLNRLEITVAYPFLLTTYAEYATGVRTEGDLFAILDVLETYVVRRFVAGVSTQSLNKIFPSLHRHAAADSGFVEAVKRILATKGCPRDEVFRERLASGRLYGGGRSDKAKFILERLEAVLGHKERVETEDLSIEHVMPQSLTDEWKVELGDTWEEDHDELLHTLGNLTLTGYNSELSNSAFGRKKEMLAESHLELNGYFENVDRWTAKEIDRRSEALAERAVSVWPYFGPLREVDPNDDDVSVKGTIPSVVRLRSQSTAVQSWTEVAVVTLEAIASIGAEEFQRVTAELPRLVTFDPSRLGRSARPRRLANGAYAALNLSATAIHRLCVQATQLAGLGPDEWSVVYEAVGERVDDDEGDAEAPTQVKQLQLEFWTEVRAALEGTGVFASLRAPRPQNWYTVGIGRANVHLQLSANVMESRVAAKIVIKGMDADRVLGALALDREPIERIVGAGLDWNPHPEKLHKTIRLTQDARLVDRGTWPDAIDWLTRTAASFREAFGPRVASLDS